MTIPATRRGRGLKFHGGCAFPLFTEQNRPTTMRSLGWHVDNACPLLIKGATAQLCRHRRYCRHSLILAPNQGWSQPPPPLISNLQETTVQLFVSKGNQRGNGHRGECFEYRRPTTLAVVIVAIQIGAYVYVLLIRYKYNKCSSRTFRIDYSTTIILF